jgi:cytochrome c-type biogenesis protein CcmH
MKRLFATLAMLTFAMAIHAREAVPTAEDPALEARLNNLAKELRCLVCQNETLADSHADLAVDLRREIRDKMRQGMSDKDITRYLTQRYGDFVLYRPPVKSTTWLLWFGPFLLLLGGGAGFVYFLQRRRQSVPDAPLSQDEEARVNALLGAGTQTSHKEPQP